MARRGLLLAALLCLAVQTGSAQRVNVTILVQGTINVLLVHEQQPHKTDSAGQPASSYSSSARPEVEYTLSDRSPDGEMTPPIRVEFDGVSAASLTTGDIVEAPVSLVLTARQASRLSLSTDNSSTGRRLLSEEHEAARRMILEFHNTRRSVQEVQNLFSVLGKVGAIAGKTLRAAALPTILERTEAQDLFIVNGQPQNIRSLTFVYKSTKCNIFPNLNASVIRQWWYDNGDKAPVVATMQRQYQTCSYNQLTFLPENNMVFDVDVPCSGYLADGKPYNLRSARTSDTDAERFALLQLGKEYLQSTHPEIFKRWSSFHRKIMIFPFNWRTGSGVAWRGLAWSSLGCAVNTDCSTWLNEDLSATEPDMQVAFQELGHNIGLMHSGRWVRSGYDQYGDMIDPMGGGLADEYRKGILCTNAPQAYKAGWASPVPNGNFRADSLRVGVPVQYSLPAMALDKQNMLRIVIQPKANPSDIEAPEQALFVSYRVRQETPGGYDSGLRYQLNSLVWVHLYNETANEIPANHRSGDSWLLDGLTEENGYNYYLGGKNLRSYYQPVPSLGAGGVTISVIRRTPRAATVTVCRYSRMMSEAGDPNSCFDGVDNDCDGLADSADPDCAGAVVQPIASPPPSRSSPPPPSPQQRPPLLSLPPPPRRSPSPPPLRPPPSRPPPTPTPPAPPPGPRRPARVTP
ncbi:hypothetical protein PLESTB_001589000 [Pleodorina starrii]|uniref:Peptidase M11 gametolysin domain-containing protein n=1 Tax=Pleodorina starrii TaxID=330485 RepID=A0A9W6BXT0_9CHLO|nr:hypothetical protein PLESTB_001589000 [Pleodorina starrii]